MEKFFGLIVLIATAAVCGMIFGHIIGQAQVTKHYMDEAIKKGHAIYRLNEATGEVTWEWLPPCRK